MQRLESFCSFIGALNLKWNVLPLCRKVAAIPLETTAIASCSVSALVVTTANSVFSSKVLPVPPHALKKTKKDSTVVRA